MTALTLLDRLSGVKRTGPGRWLARCPAHDDSRASLSVRELDDRRVLFHCFAGCDAETILAAVGLGWQDILPPRAVDHHRPRERAPFPAVDVLRAIAHESLIVCVAAAMLQEGQTLPEPERQRMGVAYARILAGVQLAGIRP